MVKNPGRDLRNFPDWLHHELLNWSRWCWLGPWPHPLPPNQCGSVERYYIRVNDENTTEGARSIPPNTDRAMLVNSVWDALPDDPRQVLRAEYPQYHESGRAEFGRVGAARKMKMRLRDYENALCVAIGRVWDVMEGKR
jgi:hypothetical protein